MKLNILLIGLVSFAWSVSAQSTFLFQGSEIQPGTRKHITVEISDSEFQTTIPVTIFHGAKDGPVLGITAGVHGYEYAPILAGQQLITAIDPKVLSGTIILVQISNVESFLGRSPYLNPMDDKNLNRVFPGDPNGTITERIAHFITTKVIDRSDFFVDMHSGDAPEDLVAYTAYYQHDQKPEISETGRLMASHMGFDYVVVFETTSKDYMKEGQSSLYCSAEAFKRGIPAMDIECGRLGIIEKHLVEKITAGMIGLLRQLEMMKGTPTPAQGIEYISNRHYAESEHAGIFYPLKKGGEYVTEGMKVGYITDFFGLVLDEVYAPASGILLYILGTPPVNKGETLVSIGEVNTR